MPQEIERKFLIIKRTSEYATKWLYQLYPSITSLKINVITHGKLIRQGYMSIETGMKLAREIGIDVDFVPEEARIRDKAGELLFTLKGPGNISRNEIECRISKDLHKKYWPCTKGMRIEKVRLEIPFERHILVIDVYADRELILAEVETSTIEEAIELKPLGLEVTNDPRYKNRNLAK